MQPDRLWRINGPDHRYVSGDRARVLAMLAADELHTRFTGTFRLIVEKLARYPGRIYTADQIAEYVYRDDLDGGPECARKCVHVTICHQRDRVEKFGWKLKSFPGRAGGYWIEALSDPAT